jgi:hypothetical protein
LEAAVHLHDVAVGQTGKTALGVDHLDGLGKASSTWSMSSVAFSLETRKSV